MNGSKCHLFKTKLPYCGHIISEKGIETNPDKVSQITEWPIPSNGKALREFLGLAGYYRRFVHNFAQIAKPLYHLIGGLPGKRGSKKVRGNPPPWEWEDSQQDAFDSLKKSLSSPPVLGYAQFDLPFILYTDASSEGLGAVLAQQQGDEERVLAYASRGLSAAEKNYATNKLEFLALKWAVTEKFSDYLYGAKHQTIVFTDNNPLTYVLSSAKLDATGHRWLASLSVYDLLIKYRPGKSNSNADALSRLPGYSTDKYIDSEQINAISRTANNIPYVECLCLSACIDISDDNEDLVSRVKDLRKSQTDDETISAILRMLRQQIKPKLSKFRPSSEIYKLVKNLDHLKVKRGILYRVTSVDGDEKWQVVLPKALREQVMEALHDRAGHQSRDRTLSLVRDRCWWPGMWSDVERKIKQCDRCIRRKSNTNVQAPLVNITTSTPLELVCIDFLTLERSKGGFENVLVMTDHFTRYALAVPTKDQSAKTTAEAIYNNLIVHYGVPGKIHSDQGANFDGKLINQLCRVMGIKKSRTTIYHPAGNGMCERFNRTLMNMLGTLDPEQKKDWKSHISTMVYAQCNQTFVEW